MLQVRFSAPAPPLTRLVRFYVQRPVRIDGDAIVHPVPARATSMIEFDFEDRVDVRDVNQGELFKSPPAVLVGPQTHRRVDMHLRGTLESFVIMFQPDGFDRLFSIPMRELTDRNYEVESVLGRSIAQLRQRLGECRSFHERVRLVDTYLLGPSIQSRGFDAISAAAHQTLLAGGRVNIPSLAAQSSMSTRQFERRFSDRVGMRPKLFARIARFEAALDHKARFAAKSWTDVAIRFGYYDQMHMIHDFAEFTGGTPTETLSQLETILVEQIRSLRSGASASNTDPRLML